MANFTFMLLLDIPAEHEDDFNRLYDSDHLRHMMQVEGNLRCDRYRLDWSDNPDMQRYLALYELTDPELPRSEAWQEKAKLGAWPRDMRHLVINRSHGVFRELSAHKPRDAAGRPQARDHIYFLQQGVPAGLEERFNLLYDTDHIPHMLETPGVSGCRRFHLEWSASGDVPGYLAIYGIDQPERPRSPEWKAQTGKGAWPTEMRPNFTARRNGAFTRIAEHLHRPG